MNLTNILICLASVTVSLKATTYNKVICEGQVFTIQCPVGEKLAIDHANYGHTDTGTCGASSVDNCHLPEAVAVLNQRCFHQSECSITVDNTFFKDPCPDEPKYLNITYSCVDEQAITEACTKYLIKINGESHGYIKSFRYPGIYQEKSDCVVKLKPRPGYRYDLTLLDLDVQNRDGIRGCYDWLIIKNEENAGQHFNHCGKYPYIHTEEPTKMEQMDNVAVIFKSDAFNERNRGFIVKYQEVEEKPLHWEL